MDASSTIGTDGSSADVSVHVPNTPLNLGVNEEGGSFHRETTFSFGESAFIGVGGTVVW